MVVAEQQRLKGFEKRGRLGNHLTNIFGLYYPELDSLTIYRTVGNSPV